MESVVERMRAIHRMDHSEQKPARTAVEPKKKYHPPRSKKKRIQKKWAQRQKELLDAQP